MASPDSLLALSSWYSKNLPFGSPGFGAAPDYNNIWGSYPSFGSPGFGGLPEPMMTTQFTEPSITAPMVPSNRLGVEPTSSNYLKTNPGPGEGLQKGLNTAGTVASLIPGLQGLGIGLNIAGTLLGVGRAIKSYRDADKMTSPYLPAPEEIKKPYTGVTAAEYAAQESGINNLYATTVRAGQLLGKDTSTGAMAQSIEAKRQQAAQNAEINRRADELGVNIDQYNLQAYQQWAREKAGLDWQTEAMRAGIKSEAWQTGVQGVLNLGQNIVSMGNVATSYAANLEGSMPDLVATYTEAITSGTPQGIEAAIYIENLMKERQQKINNPYSIYGFGKGRI